MFNYFFQPHPMALAVFTKENIVAAIEFLQKFGMNGSADMITEVGKLGGDNISYLQVILKYTSPIAFAMMLIYFAIGIVEEAQQHGGEIDLKSFIKAGIGLLVGCLMIQVAPHIIGRLVALNDALVSSENMETLKKSFETTGEFNEDPSSYNIIALCFLLVMSVISVLPQAISMLIIVITVFSAKIEVMLRLGFAPLGMSGFASDSGRHNAIRYFRKLVASMLYMFGIALVLYIAYSLSAQVGKDSTLSNALLDTQSADTSNLFIMWVINFESSLFRLAVPFAAIGAISAMKGVVNEALGA